MDQIKNYMSILKRTPSFSQTNVRNHNRFGVWTNRTSSVKTEVLNELNKQRIRIKNWEDIEETHLQNIVILRLNNSRITTLKSEDLMGMINLDSLSINGSNIKQFPEGFFEYLPNIRSLQLTNSKIEKFSNEMKTKLFYKIQRVYIEESKMHLFEGLEKNYPNLDIAIPRN